MMWALGDGNSVAHTEDYATYLKWRSVSGTEWFGTYRKDGYDFAWQVIFPTRLKRRLRKLVLQNATPEGP